MRKPDLTLHFGTGLFMYMPEGRRLEKVLKRLDLTLEPGDPLQQEEEHVRLSVIFRRCIDKNVISVPTAFRQVPESNFRSSLFMAH